MPREPGRLHITQGNIYDGLNECGNISNGISISGISRALNNNIQGKISAVVKERFCVQNMAYTHIHSAISSKKRIEISRAQSKVLKVKLRRETSPIIVVIGLQKDFMSTKKSKKFPSFVVYSYLKESALIYSS